MSSTDPALLPDSQDPPLVGALERRASVGAALGGGAGLMLAVLEGWFVVVGRPLAFDTPSERTRFALCLFGLLAGAGGVLGALGGVVAHGVALAAARIGDDPRWRLRLATLLAVPGVAVIVSVLAAGRRVRALPARPLVLVLVTLLGIVAVHLSFLAAHKILGARFTGRRRIMLTALLMLAVGCHFVDVEVLPRLYPAFHLTLRVMEAGLALLGAALLLQRSMPPRRWVAVALALTSLASARWSLRQLSFWAPLRAVAFEETTVCATVLGATLTLHIAPRALQRPAHLAQLPPREPSALPPGPRAPDADVFLITVDAMRGDRLDPRVAPRMAALAAEGTRFEHAYSAVPHTSFSITSLLTGKNAWSLAAIGEPLEAHDTLADLFKRERYKTAAFFPPSVFFIDHERFAPLERDAFRFEYVKYEYMAAPGRTDQVIRFLENERPERVFAWVHYFDPHEPYQVHPRNDGGTWLVTPDDGGAPPESEPIGAAAGSALERYDGEVTFTDYQVGRLVDWIRAHRPGAIIAFTADHGEEFGEHGGRYHGTTLYEEQVRVPLFIVGPQVAAGRTVRAPVTLVDVAPTLLGLADMVTPVRMRGRDLGPWLGRAAPPEERIGPSFSEINAKKLVARGAERLICDVSRDFCELYDLDADPGEQRSLAGRAPERVAALHVDLEAWMGQHSAFEREHGGGEAERAQRALERSRLGDRAAAPEVARLLGSSDARLLDRGAEALLRLPDEPAIRDAIFEAQRRHPDHLMIAALALRAGNVELADPLARLGALPTAAPDALSPSVLGEVALALHANHHPDAPERLRAALQVVDNEELERRILRTLGESHDRAALPALLEHLDTSVRTRFETVHAIGVLGDRRAVRPLAQLLPHERYVTVRAEMARVLGTLATSRERTLVITALNTLLRAETEAVVRDEADAALKRLHR